MPQRDSQIMSFLPPLDDERETLATLEDALAFIDAHEQQQKEAVLAVDRIRRFKPTQRASGIGASTKKLAHRERVKAELLRLRYEAAALEICLTRLKLKRAFPNGAGAASTDSSTDVIAKHSSAVHRSVVSTKWIEIVVREYQRRKQSEAANRQLKALLRRLSKAAKSPEKVLVTGISKEDELLAGLSCDVVPMQIALPPDEIQDMESLANRIDHLHSSQEFLLRGAGLTDEAAYIFHTKHRFDQTLGPVFQSASSTPLSSTTVDADCLFQKYHNNGTCNMSDPSLMTYTSIFQFEGQLHPMRGVMRKHMDADRIVYVWTSVSCLRSEGFSLKEEGIIKIARPHTSTLGSKAVESQLQTWYTAHTAPHAPSPNGNAANCAAEKLLQSHGHKMSTILLKFTEDLQDDTKGKISERVHAICAVY